LECIYFSVKKMEIIFSFVLLFMQLLGLILLTMVLICQSKREKKRNALPEGITPDMLKKHLVYCKDRDQREYFKLVGHPKLKNVTWEFTKSNDISVQKKLVRANEFVERLEQEEEEEE